MSVLFSEEQDNDHYDCLFRVEEKEKLDIFGEICFYRETLPNTFYLCRSSIFD
jgi:hypothetical protein